MNAGRPGRRGGDPPWASFSDALSGVLFVFILTTCWFAWQLAKASTLHEEERARLEGYREVARKLVGTEAEPGLLTACLQDEPAMQVVPQRSDARILLYLTSVDWFGEGRAELNGDKQWAAVRAVRKCLGSVLARPEGGLIQQGYRITVFFEGHTDALLVKKSQEGVGFASNWELSGARGAAVLSAVMENVAIGPLEGHLTDAVAEGSMRLLPVGRGDTEPAWARLCDPRLLETFGDAVDVAVCGELPWEEVAAGDATRVRERVAAVLDRHPEAWTEVPLDCGRADRTFVAKTATQKLVFWANRCPAAPSGTLAPSNDARRGLFRRVDLRIELDPLTDEAPDASR